MSKMKRLLENIQTEKTKVIFRKFPDGEVIALFPELPGDSDILNCLNYMHIGQHGNGEALLIGKPAKPEEYKELFDELTAIGYNLTVVSRFSYQMDQRRIAAIRQMNENYNKVPSDNVDDYAPDK